MNEFVLPQQLVTELTNEMVAELRRLSRLGDSGLKDAAVTRRSDQIEVRRIIGLLLDPTKRATSSEPDANGAPPPVLAGGYRHSYFSAADQTIVSLFDRLGFPNVQNGPDHVPAILRDIVNGAMSRAYPDANGAAQWRAELERGGDTPFDYVTGKVTDAIIRSAAEADAFNDVSELVVEFYDSIVDVFAGAESEHAYVRTICDTAHKVTQGSCVTPHGALLVAVIGLERAGISPASMPDRISSVFASLLGDKSSEELAQLLYSIADILTGARGDKERPVGRRLAEKIFDRAGWLVAFAPTSSEPGRGLASKLLEGMGRLEIAEPQNSVIDPMATKSQFEDDGVVGKRPFSLKPADSADAQGTHAEARPFRLLRSSLEKLAFKPLHIAIIGQSGVGKTTWLTGIFHDGLECGWSMRPGVFAVPDREIEEHIRETAERWSDSQPLGSTRAGLAYYGLDMREVEEAKIVFSDHRGELISYRRTANFQGVSAEILAEHLRSADGIVLMPVSEKVAQAARDGLASLDRDHQFKVHADRAELMGLYHEVMKLRGYIPTAIVLNRADEVFAQEECGLVLKEAALLGSEPREGFGTADVARQVKSFANRTRIGTASFHARNAVHRMIDVLGELIGVVATATNRWEIFFVNALPNRTAGEAGQAAGSRRVVDWMLAQLLPGYLRQVLEQIDAADVELRMQEKGLARAKRGQKALAKLDRVESNARWLPGSTKVPKWLRKKTMPEVTVPLRAAGVELRQNPTELDIADAIRIFEERVGFTRCAVNAARERFINFQSKLHRSP